LLGVKSRLPCSAPISGRTTSSPGSRFLNILCFRSPRDNSQAIRSRMPWLSETGLRCHDYVLAAGAQKGEAGGEAPPGNLPYRPSVCASFRAVSVADSPTAARYGKMLSLLVEAWLPSVMVVPSVK